MPNTEIQEEFQLLHGHGSKQLTSPETHINGTAAPDSQHSTPTESPDQDRPEGSAEQTAGRPTTPELPNGNPLCTPRRLAGKAPSAGEAAGPPTPMQPPTGTRRNDTSPGGRSAEELLQPEKVPQETVVPQRNQHVAQPRPAPSKRAPAPAQQLPAARYLNLQHGSRDGPPTNGGPRSPPRNTEDMHDHLSSLHMQEEEPWQDIDPEMSQDMEEWLREGGVPQDTQYYNPGQYYNQEYDHYQDRAWSGSSPVHMPPHHTPLPQPPRQPYPGGPHPTTFHQPHMQAGMVVGFPAMHPGVHYTQEGQQFIVGFPPKVEGWVPAVSHHDRTHPHDRYAAMPHGARYPQSIPAQLTQQEREYYAMCAEQQRRLQLAMMEQPAYVQGLHPVAYHHPPMAPINVPMQQFSGGQGSEYGGSYHGQQRSSGSGHRQQGGFPGRRGHRHAQSSRAGSARSGGSGSSNSGRHSPARQRSADPAAVPPPLTLQDVLKDLAKMCNTQDGSRQVQALLDTANPQEISDFVAGFVEHVQAMEVVTDSFGNYVAQRLILKSGAQARLALGRLLAPAMLELSKHQYGCRVVQNAIQSLPTIESKVEMAIQLKGQVMSCVLNSHGNHVVQCCISNIPDAQDGQSIEFMLEELRDATLKLSPEALGDRAAAGEREEAGFIGVAKHGYGCRVVQRVMEHCLLPGWKDDICRQVAEHACELAQTSFGNYVIQSCLALCSEEDREIAYANLMTQIGVLAFHKNASNVYEKLICTPEGRRMTPAQLDGFFQRLLRDSGNRAEPGPLLDRLIPQQYGNYIVNSCVVLMSGEQVATVKARIEAEQRLVEANAKSTKQVRDRVAKLLAKASECLEQATADATAGDQ
ncbi:g2694 [Coccomyxa viridis]|uniref:G2694 protein n=1 Tax=Coccomyxa viridis TaxID=1274662 RepID=A0ABP1FNA7_9CHLO